jgi:hypothetical protein
LACLADTCCQGMTFTQGQSVSSGSCRGYSKSYFGKGANQTSAGSRSYLRKKQKPCCEFVFILLNFLFVLKAAFSL